MDSDKVRKGIGKSLERIVKEKSLRVFGYYLKGNTMTVYCHDRNLAFQFTDEELLDLEKAKVRLESTLLDHY